MGIGSYMLAGALQGVGQGITRQAESNIAQARAVALENLRASNQQAATKFGGEVARQNATHQAGLNDTLAENQAGRGLVKDLTVARERGTIQIGVDDNRGRIAATNEAADDTRDLANAITLDDARTRNDLTEEEFKAAKALERQNGQVSWQRLASGQIVGVTNDGRTITPQARRTADGRPLYLRGARPDDSGGQDGGGATVGSARAGRTGSGASGASPVARTTTTENPVRETVTPTNSGGIGRRVVEPSASFRPITPEESFQIQQDTASSTFQTAAAVANRPSTYTVAQLREFARAADMTEAQARQWASANGFKITR